MNTTTRNEEAKQAKAFFRHENGEFTVDLAGLKAEAGRYAAGIEKLAADRLPRLRGWALARRRMVTAAAAGVLVFAIGTGMAAQLVSNAGCQGVLRGICRTVNERDASLDGIAQAVLPGFAMDQYEDVMEIIGDVDAVAGGVEKLERKVDRLYVNLDDVFGANAKVSYEVLEKEKMSQSQMRRAERSYQDFYEGYLEKFVDTVDDYDYEQMRALADRFDLTTSDVKAVRESIDILAEKLEEFDVSAGYNLVIGLRVEGSRDSYYTEVELRVIKANGDWMLDYTSVGATDRVLQKFGSSVKDLLWYL